MPECLAQGWHVQPWKPPHSKGHKITYISYEYYFMKIDM